MNKIVSNSSVVFQQETKNYSNTSFILFIFYILFSSIYFILNVLRQIVKNALFCSG